jgi:hypothetical protein
MLPRIVVTNLICAAALLAGSSLSAQRTNQSDATGAFPPGVFSRGFTQAFAAPPAPPPVLVTTPEMVSALCIERSDAFLTMATLSLSPENNAERLVFGLLKGGTSADQSARPVYDALVRAGADPAQTSALIDATNGLLAGQTTEVTTVANAVGRYNTLVRSAPSALLSAPPEELIAMRGALGRLGTTAITAYDPNRNFPGWSLGPIGYVTDTSWLQSGRSILIAGGTYLQIGAPTALADRQLRRVGEHNGAWVFADASAAGQPKQVFVAMRMECDVSLVPFTLQEPVRKR